MPDAPDTAADLRVALPEGVTLTEAPVLGRPDLPATLNIHANGEPLCSLLRFVEPQAIALHRTLLDPDEARTLAACLSALSGAAGG